MQHFVYINFYDTRCSMFVSVIIIIYYLDVQKPSFQNKQVISVSEFMLQNVKPLKIKKLLIWGISGCVNFLCFIFWKVLQKQYKSILMACIFPLPYIQLNTLQKQTPAAMVRSFFVILYKCYFLARCALVISSV